MAAVLQVPLEPNTGAGVVIAAKVNDEDEDVAVAALRAAGQLHDAVVARNLTRYIRDATTAIAAGFYGPEQQDIARTVALFVWESGKIIGSAGATESVPALCEALRFFGQSPYWDHYRRARLIQVLGELGDRQAASLLLEFLDDAATLRWHTTEDNKRVTQTVGDVALQSLLRLYELNPADFGLLTPLAGGQFAGYADEEARREGHRAFRIWHEQHARSQPAQNRPSASQPARDKD
jgi:hypothetical protein